MRLLERSDVTAKLVDLGHQCVEDWKKNAAKTGYNWSGDETKMAEYVNHFLEKYRNQSTRLGISSRPLGDAYAETVFEIGYVLPDPFCLDPKVLTNVVLDKEVCRIPSPPSIAAAINEPISQVFDQVVQNDAKRARLFAPGSQEKAKDLKAFAKERKDCADLGAVLEALLGVVLFHEFAHCYVFFLGMDGRPNTPPNVKGLARPSNTGESGDCWRRMCLGELW